MRLATCIHNNQTHLAVVQENSALLPLLSKKWPKNVSSMLQVIDNYEQYLQKLDEIIQEANIDQWISLKDVELLSPIPRPRQNIMCLGWKLY